MSLDWLWIPSKAGQVVRYSGMDCVSKCLDKQHFENYDVPIIYKYNSRGFRDSEWPDLFDNVIWCIGDSFTVGIGSPIEHTWPYLLCKSSGYKTINLSMDGASNNWIFRIVKAILNEFDHAKIVVHWSYIHRRELDEATALAVKWRKFYHDVKDPSWPQCEYHEIDNLSSAIKKEICHLHGWKNKVYDDERLVHSTKSSVYEDLHNTNELVKQLPNNIIQSSIPFWTPPGVNISHAGLIHTKQIDKARDGHHYDILTAKWLVDKILSVADW